MSELLLAKYNDNEIIVDFVPSTFTPGQTTYHYKITFNFNDDEQFYEWEIVPSTNNIPALRFGSGANIDNPNYPPADYTSVTPPAMFASLYGVTGVESGGNPGISSYTLVDSGGDIGITMASPVSTFRKQLSGTVSNCVLKITIETDFPIFCSELQICPVTQPYQMGDCYSLTSQAITDDNGYVVNCVSGDMSSITNAVNYASVVDTIPKNQEYYIENRLKKNGAIVETKLHRFQIPPGAKIWLVAPQHDNGGQTYNMTLNMSGTMGTFRYKIGSGAWTVGHLITPTLGKYYYGSWTNYNNGDLYVTINATNIPIFATETEGDMYMAGELDESDSLNAGELQHQKPTTGDDLESTDIPNISVSASGVGCNVWALTSAQIKNVMNVLFDDDQTIIDDIKDGTWLWGNNPADFIISMYYVPFDVSNFYNVSSHRLYLGFHDTGYEYLRVSETKSSGQRITLCTTTIDPVYNDWRDYTNFKYEIYLPFVGFFPLDVMSYLNKRLTIELAFDIMTHNIRYYLFANDKLIDRVDGSVGYDIPLLATDQVNKAKSDLTGIQNVFKGGADMVGGAMGVPGTSISSGISEILTGVQNIKSYPKIEVVGNVSSSMNIYDINYCYLKITEKDTLKPSQLNAMYNYPSYYVGNVSALSGYSELANIQFNCSGMESEIEEIMSLLRNGVIL